MWKEYRTSKEAVGDIQSFSVPVPLRGALFACPMRELKPRNVSMGSLATNQQQTPSAAEHCVPGLSPPSVYPPPLGSQSCPFIASSKRSENLELPQLIIDDKITDITFWKKPWVSFNNYLDFSLHSIWQYVKPCRFLVPEELTERLSVSWLETTGTVFWLCILTLHRMPQSLFTVSFLIEINIC